MSVPFTYLFSKKGEEHQQLSEKLQVVLDRGVFVGGIELDRFESDFAKYCGVAYGVGVGNGLEALTLTLKAWGIGYGDEVLVPSHTFIATWLAVTAVGAKPVPVPTSKTSYNIELAGIESVMSPSTRAVIGVHLYGQPCEANMIRDLCDSRGVYFLEDCAQAHGASLAGKKVGSFGHAAAFSFYPTKTLGALGDGGIVITDDARVAKKVRELSNYGSITKYVHNEFGTNSRLDELQAAFLNVRLKSLDEENYRRRRIASLYAAGLSDTPLILPLDNCSEAEHVYHLYVVRCGTNERKDLQDHLAAHGISSLIHYPIPCADQECYAKSEDPPPSLECARDLSQAVLSLPVSPHHSDDEVKVVIDVVKTFYA